MIRRSTDGLIEVMAKLSEAGMSVSSSAVTIQSLVRDTSSSIGSMLSSLRGVSMCHGLQDSSERGAAFIVQMANSNDEILRTCRPWPNRPSVDSGHRSNGHLGSRDFAKYLRP